MYHRRAVTLAVRSNIICAEPPTTASMQASHLPFSLLRPIRGEKSLSSSSSRVHPSSHSLVIASILPSQRSTNGSHSRCALCLRSPSTRAVHSSSTIAMSLRTRRGSSGRCTLQRLARAGVNGTWCLAMRIASLGIRPLGRRSRPPRRFTRNSWSAAHCRLCGVSSWKSTRVS